MYVRSILWMRLGVGLAGVSLPFALWLTTYGEGTRHALVDTGKPYAEVHFSNLAVHLASISGTRPLESRFTKSAVGLVMGFRQYSYVGAVLALTLALDDESFLGEVGSRSADH